MSENLPAPKIGAIAVLFHGERFLLVQRGKNPGLGQWGFPGGHVELGETAKAAAVRELWEETSIKATAGDYMTAVDVIDWGQGLVRRPSACEYRGVEDHGRQPHADRFQQSGPYT